MKRLAFVRITSFIATTCLLVACASDPPVPGSLDLPKNRTAGGAAVGAVGGFSIEKFSHPFIPLIGVGAALGGAIGSFYENTGVIRDLEKRGGHYYVIGDHVRIILPIDAFFEPDETSLKPETCELIGRLTKGIKAYGKHEILITGFSDDIPMSDEQNANFTFHRAQSVATFMWTHGIPSEDLTVQGLGMEPTVADNRRLDGSAFNRRIEITFRI